MKDIKFKELHEYIDSEQFFSLLLTAATSEMERELVAWRLGYRTNAQMTELHGVSLSSLYQRWKAFEIKLVLIAQNKRLI